MSISAPTPANTHNPIQNLNGTPQASALELSSDARPYASLANKELAGKLLTNFQAVDAYGNDFFNLYTLKALSKGEQQDGQTATPEQRQVASELLNRRELLDDLDIYPNGGVEDGRISWDAVAVEAGKFSFLSDRELLQQAKIYHKEIDSNGDGYVNLDELKEAETRPTGHFFSSEAKETANALLERGTLLDQLGNRYDIGDLGSKMRKASSRSKVSPGSKTD